MALARILVDGYSLLHKWLAIAPGQARHSEAARAELVRWLTRYHDATGSPISVFFDGTGKTSSRCVQSSPQVEILYSRTGQTADQMIERATHRLLPYGEVLVVTDDRAEQQTVIALGGMAIGCQAFIQMVEQAIGELQDKINRFNKCELTRFKRQKTQ